MLHIHKLSPNDATDFAALICIFQQVFDHENTQSPDIQNLNQLLAKENFWVLVAKEEDTVVGGLTVHLLPNYYEGGLTAYIYDVGVQPALQGKGIGKQLIAYLCKYCQSQGIEEAYVEAEAEDVEAIAFYRKTAYSSESPFMMFHFNLT